MENIEKLQAEIREHKIERENFSSALKNGFNKKVVLVGDIHILGLDSVMKNYDEKLFKLEKELRDEYIKLIVPIGNSNLDVDVKVEIPLIDYNVPFKFVEYSGMNSIQPTGDDKIFFYFLTKQFSAFYELERFILTERGFFNQADVILNKGIAPYLNTIKNAKRELKYYNLIDKNGNVTAIGRSVKEIFDKVINADEKIDMEMDGKVSMHRLIGLISRNIEYNKEKDWLVNFDKVDKLATNVELLYDTYQKWHTRRNY